MPLLPDTKPDRLGEPVTMTVANASDMSLPDSAPTIRDGMAYYGQSSGALNILMTQRNGRWVCLSGKISVPQLMDLAGNLQF